MKQLFLLAIRGYQKTVSPSMPATCRYEPSCSHYGHEAIERYGAVRVVAEMPLFPTLTTTILREWATTELDPL